MVIKGLNVCLFLQCVLFRFISLNEIHVLSDVTEPSSTADGKASLPIHVYTAHVTVLINLGMYIVGTDSTYSVANPLCSVTESIAGSDDGLMFYSTVAIMLALSNKSC